jgi:oligoribonuclease
MQATLVQRNRVEVMSSSPDRALTDRIVWIDCEMTGLSLENDALVEVAALVTDFELNILGDGVDVVIKPTDEALTQMGDFVREMHTSSGLIDEFADGVTIEEAQQRVLDYVREWVPEPRKAPLGGNTVATDRGFLARDMPELEEHLHYRIIDVSSIKELARRWYPRAYFNAPKKAGGHRALADILESIDELRYYREAVFVPQPGPDSKTAKAIAERVVATSVTRGRTQPADAAVDAEPAVDDASVATVTGTTEP